MSTHSSMKIYILSPRVREEHTYSLHQLCSHINALRSEAYIFYGPNPEQTYTNLYPEIPRVKVHPVNMIEDSAENLFIVSDPSQVAPLYTQCKNIRYAIWWLHPSLSYPLEHILLQDIPIIHLFPTMYTYYTVRPLLAVGSKVFFLGDSIEDRFIVFSPEEFLDSKENVVVYHGKIDQMTSFICENTGISCIDVSSLTAEQRREVYKRAKVFANFGYHLGKSLYMREAAACGCIIITHRSGAANCKEDIPIEEKIGFDTEIVPLLSDIFQNFQTYYIKQDDFRLGIRGEKTEAIVKTQLFLENVGCVSQPT